MQALIDNCPSLLLGAAAYTQEALVEILKEPECQKLAAALISASVSTESPTLIAQKRDTTTANLSISGLGIEEELLFPVHVRLFLTIIFMLLSMMGIVGNLMVITVVLKVPGMITPTNCYLMSLAASDCLFFIAAAPTEFSTLHVTSREYIFGHVGCAILTYIPYLAINSSSLSITAFTIERFIGICYPLKARYICTVSRAKLIIIVIWTFSLLYNSHWLYMASLVEDEAGQYCDFKYQRDSWTYKLVFLFDFTTFYVIPMILYVVIYGKITYTLTVCSMDRKGKQPFRKLTGPQPNNIRKNVIPDSDSSHKDSIRITSEQQPLSQKRSLSTCPSNSFVSSAGRKGSSRGKVQIQIIKMLAVVVVIFASCWLPYRAMVMYNSFATIPFNPRWYIMFAKILIFINCAINPILYNVMSARFRNAFRRLLRGNHADNKELAKNCTVTLSRPPTATQRHDDLRSFLSLTQSSPEHENG